MKIFQREQRSLFGEILDWMLTPLLLLWPVSLALTWLVAQGIASQPFDRTRSGVGRKPGRSNTFSLLRFHCPPMMRTSPGALPRAGKRPGWAEGFRVRPRRPR